MTVRLQCQRCKWFSGDDWSQCHGSCPVEQSPYFDPGALAFYGPLVEYTEEDQSNDWRN